MSKNQEKDYTISMENAEASVCMEGYTVTPEMREQCERVLWGEATGTTWLVWHYAKMIKYGKPGICVKHKPGFLCIAAKEG